MLVEAQVGEYRYAQGTNNPIRQSPYGGVVVQQAHGRLFETARNGRVYHASSAMNIAFATATPIGAGGTAPFAIYNPLGSGKAFSILKATVQLLLGATPVPIQPVWNVTTAKNAQITAAGGITPVNARLDGTLSVAQVFSNAALTGSTAGTLLRPFAASIALPTAAATQLYSYVEETDGAILLTPNTCLIIVGSVAGTNVTGQAGITWEELDWPL